MILGHFCRFFVNFGGIKKLVRNIFDLKFQNLKKVLGARKKNISLSSYIIDRIDARVRDFIFIFYHFPNIEN